MPTPDQGAANVTHGPTHHAGNISRERSFQVNGNYDSHDTKCLDRNTLHVEKYEDRRTYSIVSGDSSLRSPSPGGRPQFPAPSDEENPPNHPPPAPFPMSVQEQRPASHPIRSSTWSSIKGFYCRKPRSLFAIVGIIIIAAILSIVIPLYLTAEARMKRSLADAEEAASEAWPRHPPPTIAAISSASSPTLASSVAPL